MPRIDGSPTVAAAAGDRLDRRLLVTVLSCVVVFTSSMTIVSASLPTMAKDLDSTESLLSWSVTGLFLVMSVTTPVMGRLGDGRGHRRVFLAIAPCSRRAPSPAHSLPARSPSSVPG